MLLLTLLALVACAAYVYATRAAPAANGATPPTRVTGELRVHYVDVGQGDGIVWELPDGSIAIYDCGPPEATDAENPLVAYLRGPLGRPEGSPIAALIASHGHLDHIGGCEELFASYQIESVYDAGYEGADAPASYRRFRDEVTVEGATVHTLPEIQPGMIMDLPGVRASFLWPRAFSPGGWDAVAEASLVVRLEHGATSYCFQGDIETRQESQLEQKLGDAGCDVYLVGHHGSQDASSARWLARMHPSLAVVSYGENPYGHPTDEALCRVQRAGAEVYATAGAGAIVISSDGASVSLLRGSPPVRDMCPVTEIS